MVSRNYAGGGEEAAMEMEPMMRGQQHEGNGEAATVKKQQKTTKTAEEANAPPERDKWYERWMLRTLICYLDIKLLTGIKKQLILFNIFKVLLG
jgi:hypothetical protein